MKGVEDQLDSDKSLDELHSISISSSLRSQNSDSVLRGGASHKSHLKSEHRKLTGSTLFGSNVASRTLSE